MKNLVGFCWKKQNFIRLTAFGEETFGMIELILKIAPYVSAAIIALSAAVALAALRRATRINLDSFINGINDRFVISDVVGPLAWATFPDKSQEEKLDVQKRIVMVLHMLHLMRAYRSAYNNRILWIFRLLPKKDWERNWLWFQNSIWPWIEADDEMVAVVTTVFCKSYLQEDDFDNIMKEFIRNHTGKKITG